MPHGSTCLLMLLSCFAATSSMIHKLPMPDGLKLHFNGLKMRHNVTELPGIVFNYSFVP